MDVGMALNMQTVMTDNNFCEAKISKAFSYGFVQYLLSKY